MIVVKQADTLVADVAGRTAISFLTPSGLPQNEPVKRPVTLLDRNRFVERLAQKSRAGGLAQVTFQEHGRVRLDAVGLRPFRAGSGAPWRGGPSVEGRT